MLSPERRKLLLEHLRSNGSTRIADLVRLLGVSDVTVRRDLNALERQGMVRRFHGGVTPTRLDSPHQASIQGTTIQGTTIQGTGPMRLGVLVPGSGYYKPVLAGATEEAARSGAQLALALLRYEPEPYPDPATIKTLLREGIDGLLFTPSTEVSRYPRIADEVRSLPVPVVLIERQLDSSTLVDQFDHVVSDHRTGARLAVEHLARLGHSRIGLVVKDIGPTMALVREGYLEAATALGLDGGPLVLPVPQVDQADRNPDQRLGEALAELKDNGATAVLIHSDAEAITLTQKALASGLRVPRDLAIVSYDDDLAAFASVRLTAIAPPKRSLGRAGVALLVARLREGSARPVHHLTLQPRLVIRDSCGAGGPGRGRKPANDGM
jgi:DNA-binding LacI/PurR family transcriptional regulator